MEHYPKYPKISVVTPNFNQGNFVERTIRSVLDQGYPNLEYIIIDGDSTDNSEEIIRKYEDQLHYWVSEKDAGMYHAINKGFEKSSGSIMCWINSDDVLWEDALFKVADFFSKHKHVQWLQGYPSVIDEKGQLLYQRDPVSSKYHFYLGAYTQDFSFIQQESTFWTRSLWEKAGGKLDTTYTLAADFDLWIRFFEFEELYCTKQQLAAFRKRIGQKSGDVTLYLSEASSAVQIGLTKMKLLHKLKLQIVRMLGKSKLRKLTKWIDA